MLAMKRHGISECMKLIRFGSTRIQATYTHLMGSLLSEQPHKKNYATVEGSCTRILDLKGSQWSTSGHHGLVRSFQAKKIERYLELRVSECYSSSRMSRKNIQLLRFRGNSQGT